MTQPSSSLSGCLVGFLVPLLIAAALAAYIFLFR